VAEYYMGFETWKHYTMQELFSVTGDDFWDDEFIREPVRHEEGMEGDGPGEELLQYILQVRVNKWTAHRVLGVRLSSGMK
jgi:hypothetical protein